MRKIRQTKSLIGIITDNFTLKNKNIIKGTIIWIYYGYLNILWSTLVYFGDMVRFLLQVVFTMSTQYPKICKIHDIFI